ncbi:uncharacterized protein LOC131887060 [Tigriopus californicus]|uniref:uncharacterized protein LOC131887060 n=1 Tax=Tigriopus californicus TaxID=6832 RepID=UPI0027DA83D0|nr:uncharacterized protein LOC131887060 [Tigriopus californicus]
MKLTGVWFMVLWNTVQSGFVYFFDTSVPAFTLGSGFFHRTHKVPTGYSGPYQSPPFPLPRYGCFNELKQLVFCDPPAPPITIVEPPTESRDDPIPEDDYDYIIPRIQGYEPNNHLSPDIKSSLQETLEEQFEIDLIV